ncbi:AraC family transcriptional regulator, partial [Janthinobacterium sp. BJB401]
MDQSDHRARKELPGMAVQPVAFAAGRWLLLLLPCAPYSARDPAQVHSLGVSLQRQRGVHAIGADRRGDFDTYPGVLAQTPAGVDVFSESAHGGEYLVLRWSGEETMAARRLEVAGHAAALAVARKLRSLLLAPQADALALEQGALDLLALRPGQAPARAPAGCPCMARVLERIAGEFAQPLSLEQLAAAEGMPVLRLLRDFKRATGMTPHAHIVETRVQAARVLLRQ